MIVIAVEHPNNFFKNISIVEHRISLLRITLLPALHIQLSMMEQPYRVDRTKLTSLIFDEADNHTSFWYNKTEDERLNAACFIIHQIFGTTPQTKVDKTITDRRKHP